MKKQTPIEKELAMLNSTLREQLIDTKLVTIRQWNDEMAPRLSRVANVACGLMPDSPTARTYKLPDNYFD